MTREMFFQEAMTSDEVQAAQNAHYNCDDSIRRLGGRLTLAQKEKVIDFMRSMIPTPTEG